MLEHRAALHGVLGKSVKMTYNVITRRKCMLMASNPVTNIRIDPGLKEQASEVFDDLGLTLSAAVNVFLKAVVRERGLPFEMRVTDKAVPDGLDASQLENGQSKL